MRKLLLYTGKPLRATIAVAVVALIILGIAWQCEIEGQIKKSREGCPYLQQKKRASHIPILAYTIRYLTDEIFRNRDRINCAVVRDNCPNLLLNELRTAYLAHIYHTDTQRDSLNRRYNAKRISSIPEVSSTLRVDTSASGKER